jgi:hypothetical protein
MSRSQAEEWTKPLPSDHRVGWVRIPESWSVNRMVVLMLVGAFGGLLLDIRLEHINVVRQRWIGWTPIAYSGLVTLVSLIAVVRWGRRARRILFWFYLAAIAVGTTGFWLHSREDPLRAVLRVLAAWYSYFPHRGPPELAPLSFCALGLVGMLACAERFQLPIIFASGVRQMATSGIPPGEERRNVAH